MDSKVKQKELEYRMMTILQSEEFIRQMRDEIFENATGIKLYKQFQYMHNQKVEDELQARYEEFLYVAIIHSMLEVEEGKKKIG